ncbi:hypothetical protein [Kosakonia sacchari]|uniref:hypothetical protein n=1 Tax=Kosakonia sacchari TaxID=1158459 RepID=UPI000BE539D9|nr:hypothetical protein [Kosakonia sacchari]PDO82721.1 hypothetical protein BK797_18775 [Kosakonia sacchari]
MSFDFDGLYKRAKNTNDDGVRLIKFSDGLEVLTFGDEQGAIHMYYRKDGGGWEPMQYVGDDN